MISRKRGKPSPTSIFMNLIDHISLRLNMDIKESLGYGTPENVKDYYLIIPADQLDDYE